MVVSVAKLDRQHGARIYAMYPTCSEPKTAAKRRSGAEQVFANADQSRTRGPAKSGYDPRNAIRRRLRNSHAITEGGMILDLERDNRDREELRRALIGELLLKSLHSVFPCDHATILVRRDPFIEARKVAKRRMRGTHKRVSRVPEDCKFLGVLVDDERDDWARIHGGRASGIRRLTPSRMSQPFGPDR
jgi:hypothetical protein